MNLYADTSVVVAYYAPEPLSEDAERLLRLFPSPAVSDLVEVELYSALARKVRQGEISGEDADRARSHFSTHLAAGYYERLPLARAHYELARRWLAAPAPPLRTLDALHLAVAAVDQRTLATADRALARAAQSLRVEVLLVEEGSTSTVHEPSPI